MAGGRSDEERFEALYRSTYRDVVAYCRRRLPPDQVDDVVAATYLVAWRRLDDVLEADHPPAWLYGVAYKTIGNSRRGTRRMLALRTRLRAQPNRTSPSPSAEVLASDDVRRALAALATLDPDDQEIIRLATFEGLQYDELAVALGKTPSAIRSQLFRARQRLRAAYDGDGLS